PVDGDSPLPPQPREALTCGFFIARKETAVTTIDIHDYLTKDDIADLVREQARGQLKTDHERLMSNAVYEVVQDIISEMFETDPTLRDGLEKEVKRVIADSTNFNLFHRADAWSKRVGRGDTVGQQILDRAVKDSEPAIRAIVTRTITNLGYRDVKELVIDSIRTFWDEAEADQ